VFFDHFGLEHHEVAQSMIAGHGPFGEELNCILQRENVNIDELIDILSSSKDEYDGFFSGPINFDTIEGVLRSLSYVNPVSNSLSPVTVVMASLNRSNAQDRRIVDEFWHRKHDVYNTIINSRSGVLADAISQSMMVDNIKKINPGDYYKSEANLFTKLKGLREILMSHSFEQSAVSEIRTEVHFSARHFWVDESANFFERCDVARYRQKKEKRVLRIPCDMRTIDIPEFISQDLFDDRGY